MTTLPDHLKRKARYCRLMIWAAKRYAGNPKRYLALEDSAFNRYFRN